MEFKSLIFDVKDRVAVIKMNRPTEYNAMNFELMGEIARALEICMVNNEIRVVVITGAGKAFCSGGDLAMFHGYKDKSEAIRELTKLFHHVILGVRQNPKPVIAALNGAAAGGGFSLATACDLRICAESAKFVQGYTSSGLVPDGAWTLTVPLLVGFGRAAEMAFLDPVIGSKKALDLGLANYVVPDGELEAFTMEMASKLAKGSFSAFVAVKENLNRAMLGILESQLELERQGIIRAGKTPDAEEGIAAFLERRKPKFL